MDLDFVGLTLYLIHNPVASIPSAFAAVCLLIFIVSRVRWTPRHLLGRATKQRDLVDKHGLPGVSILPPLVVDLALIWWDFGRGIYLKDRQKTMIQESMDAIEKGLMEKVQAETTYRHDSMVNSLSLLEVDQKDVRKTLEYLAADVKAADAFSGDLFDKIQELSKQVERIDVVDGDVGHLKKELEKVLTSISNLDQALSRDFQSNYRRDKDLLNRIKQLSSTVTAITSVPIGVTRAPAESSLYTDLKEQIADINTRLTHHVDVHTAISTSIDTAKFELETRIVETLKQDVRTHYARQAELDGVNMRVVQLREEAVSAFRAYDEKLGELERKTAYNFSEANKRIDAESSAAESYTDGVAAELARKIGCVETDVRSTANSLSDMISAYQAVRKRVESLEVLDPVTSTEFSALQKEFTETLERYESTFNECLRSINQKLNEQSGMLNTLAKEHNKQLDRISKLEQRIDGYHRETVDLASAIRKKHEGMASAADLEHARAILVELILTIISYSPAEQLEKIRSLRKIYEDNPFLKTQRPTT